MYINKQTKNHNKTNKHLSQQPYIFFKPYAKDTFCKFSSIFKTETKNINKHMVQSIMNWNKFYEIYR